MWNCIAENVIRSTAAPPSEETGLSRAAAPPPMPPTEPATPALTLRSLPTPVVDVGGDALSVNEREM